MGGAYGEWTCRASRTSGGTALPPATPVGQIYTMYIDFPLDGNTLNPTVQALGRRPHIFSLSPEGPPGRVLAPSCSKSASQGLEARGPPGNPPRNWRYGAGSSWKPPQGSLWTPLEAPGGRGPWSLQAPGGPQSPPIWLLTFKNSGGCWRLEVVEGLGSCLEAPANPPVAGASLCWKEQEDDLFEVGIEGVALNPNRK